MLNLFPPFSRCTFVIHPQLRVRGTSAASATSWCSASTRKRPTQAPYRYSSFFFLKDNAEMLILLNTSLSTGIIFFSFLVFSSS